MLGIWTRINVFKWSLKAWDLTFVVSPAFLIVPLTGWIRPEIWEMQASWARLLVYILKYRMEPSKGEDGFAG